MRQLYEADIHKPGIYGSGRVWANAWDVLFCAPSRGGRGRRAAAAFAVCFGWGGFFRSFHEFAFSNSFVDPVSEQPAWTRRRESDSQPICPQRTRAHLSPPGVPFSVLPPEKFGVSSYQYSSSSQLASLIFDPTSECNLNKFFSSFESSSRICSRERKLW